MFTVTVDASKIDTDPKRAIVRARLAGFRARFPGHAVSQALPNDLTTLSDAQLATGLARTVEVMQKTRIAAQVARSAPDAPGKLPGRYKALDDAGKQAVADAIAAEEARMAG